MSSFIQSLTPALFWDVDRETIDAEKHRRFVIGRSIPDIAAMKLATVTNRGTRKDFVDVYFLLQRYSLDQLFNWYSEKYPDGNGYLVLRSLVYFDDAEQEPMPNMLQPVDWQTVCRVIVSAVTEYSMGAEGRRISPL